MSQTLGVPREAVRAVIDEEQGDLGRAGGRLMAAKFAEEKKAADQLWGASGCPSSAADLVSGAGRRQLGCLRRLYV